MRKKFLWVAVTIAAALIESTWLDKIAVEDVLPDLPLLLVIYFALLYGEERAMFTGVIGGILQDVSTTTRLGHHVLTLVIVGYVAGRLSKRLVTEHPTVKVALVFAAALVNGVLFTAIQEVQEPDIGATYIIMTQVVPMAFYTTLVTPFVFYLLDRSFARNARLESNPA